MSYFILGGGLPVACLLINEAKKKPRVSCITNRDQLNPFQVILLSFIQIRAKRINGDIIQLISKNWHG